MRVPQISDFQIENDVALLRLTDPSTSAPGDASRGAMLDLPFAFDHARRKG
jgi:hypothetical protein